jgi:hypothetical protein
MIIARAEKTARSQNGVGSPKMQDSLPHSETVPENLSNFCTRGRAIAVSSQCSCASVSRIPSSLSEKRNLLMVHARLARMALAIGLGATCGCSSMSQSSWFNWGRRNNSSEMVGCEMPPPCNVGGPMMDGSGPALMTPQNPGMSYPTQPYFGQTPATTTQPPRPLDQQRIPPMPQQAQPTPFTPQGQSPRN